MDFLNHLGVQSWFLEGGGMQQTSKPLTKLRVQARKDAASGRTFFIDHNTRATTWDRPPTPTPKPCPSPPPGPPSPAAERNGAAGGAAPTDAPSESPSEPLKEPSEGGRKAAGSSEEGLDSSREGGEAGAAHAPVQPKWGLFGLSVDEVCRCPSSRMSLLMRPRGGKLVSAQQSMRYVWLYADHGRSTLRGVPRGYQPTTALCVVGSFV